MSITGKWGKHTVATALPSSPSCIPLIPSTVMTTATMLPFFYILCMPLYPSACNAQIWRSGGRGGRIFPLWSKDTKLAPCSHDSSLQEVNWITATFSPTGVAHSWPSCLSSSFNVPFTSSLPAGREQTPWRPNKGRKTQRCLFSPTGLVAHRPTGSLAVSSMGMERG